MYGGIPSEGHLLPDPMYIAEDEYASMWYLLSSVQAEHLSREGEGLETAALQETVTLEASDRCRKNMEETPAGRRLQESWSSSGRSRRSTRTGWQLEGALGL